MICMLPALGELTACHVQCKDRLTRMLLAVVHVCDCLLGSPRLLELFCGEAARQTACMQSWKNLQLSIGGLFLVHTQSMCTTDSQQPS